MLTEMIGPLRAHLTGGSDGNGGGNGPVVVLLHGFGAPGTDLVALHARSFEPHARVIDPAHYAGLWRIPAEAEAEPEIDTGALAHLGRSFADYAAVIEVAR